MPSGGWTRAGWLDNVPTEVEIDLATGWITVSIFKTKRTRRIPITAEFDAELRLWLEYYEAEIGSAFLR